MSRSRLLQVAASLAAGIAGCAHCDTCDDFPLPCNGPSCGYNAPAPVYPPGAGGAPAYSPGPASPMLSPAPLSSSPFTSGSASAPAASAPAAGAAKPAAAPAAGAAKPAAAQPLKEMSPPNSDLPELPPN